MLVDVSIFIAAIAFAFLVFYCVQTLIEVKRTLQGYRDMQPKVVALLDNSRRLTANLEEVSRQITVQASRVDNITSDAMDMVQEVHKTVDMYNRAIARPAIFLASLSNGLKGVFSALRKKEDR